VRRHHQQAQQANGNRRQTHADNTFHPPARKKIRLTKRTWIERTDMPSKVL
jgi:hypothetical protein